MIVTELLVGPLASLREPAIHNTKAGTTNALPIARINRILPPKIWMQSKTGGLHEYNLVNRQSRSVAQGHAPRLGSARRPRPPQMCDYRAHRAADRARLHNGLRYVLPITPIGFALSYRPLCPHERLQ
jgi:hypothetical protein